MGKWLMRLGMLVATVSVLIMAGCPPQETKEAKNGNQVPEVKAPVAQDTLDEPEKVAPVPIEVPETLEKLEPEPTKIPEVKLTDAEWKECLVAVGEVWPEGRVASLGGEAKDVGTLLGEKATVVFFWAAGSSEISEKAAALALADLQGDAKEAYGDRGLAVIAINEKDSSEKVKELCGTAKIDYPVLLDSDGSYFAKVATEGLPRVYVLDSSGKIVWFDVAFSETSREKLKQTLQVMLGDR